MQKWRLAVSVLKGNQVGFKGDGSMLTNLLKRLLNWWKQTKKKSFLLWNYHHLNKIIRIKPEEE